MYWLEVQITNQLKKYAKIIQLLVMKYYKQILIQNSLIFLNFNYKIYIYNTYIMHV